MGWTVAQKLTAAEMGSVLGTIVPVSASVNPCVVGNQYLVTCGVNPITMTLPGATALAGQCVGITKVDAGTGVITVQAGGVAAILGPGIAAVGAVSFKFTGL